MFKSYVRLPEGDIVQGGVTILRGSDLVINTRSRVLETEINALVGKSTGNHDYYH
jgi:hypothetical protein